MTGINDLFQSSVLRRELDLLRVDAAWSIRSIDVLREVSSQITAKIAEIAYESSDSVNRRLQRLQVLLNRVNRIIDGGFDDLSSIMTASLSELAESEAVWTVRMINDTLGIDLASVSVSPRWVQSVLTSSLIEGAPTEDWWSRQAESLKNRFADTLREGMMQGETLSDLIRRVRGKRENGYTDGVMNASYVRTEAIVRTSVMKVANNARLATLADNSDLFSGIKWISTLDKRTSAICRALDGLTWDMDLKPVGHDLEFHTPPRHWNCRSTTVPIMKSYEELAGLSPRKMAKVDQGTRASMNGQVPAEVKYEDWLRSRPVEEQQEVLGMARWNLWTKGKASLIDMVSQSGRPLTLEQIDATA